MNKVIIKSKDDRLVTVTFDGDEKVAKRLTHSLKYNLSFGDEIVSEETIQYEGRTE